MSEKIRVNIYVDKHAWEELPKYISCSRSNWIHEQVMKKVSQHDDVAELERQIKEISLIENLQREDLNPIDTAISISNILAVKNITQEEFSKKMGKSRSYVTNLLGLLNLPKSVQELVKNGKLSMSAARSLSKIADEERVIELANKIIKEDLNVRDIEKILSNKKENSKTKYKNEKYRIYEDAISDAIGNKVKISDKKIEISYNSNITSRFKSYNGDISYRI